MLCMLGSWLGEILPKLDANSTALAVQLCLTAWLRSALADLSMPTRRKCNNLKVVHGKACNFSSKSTSNKAAKSSQNISLPSFSPVCIVPLMWIKSSSKTPAKLKYCLHGIWSIHIHIHVQKHFRIYRRWSHSPKTGYKLHIIHLWNEVVS